MSSTRRPDFTLTIVGPGVIQVRHKGYMIRTYTRPELSEALKLAGERGESDRIYVLGRALDTLNKKTPILRQTGSIMGRTARASLKEGKPSLSVSSRSKARAILGALIVSGIVFLVGIFLRDFALRLGWPLYPLRAIVAASLLVFMGVYLLGRAKTLPKAIRSRRSRI